MDKAQPLNEQSPAEGGNGERTEKYYSMLYQRSINSFSEFYSGVIKGFLVMFLV